MRGGRQRGTKLQETGAEDSDPPPPLLKREKIYLNDCINDAFIVKVQTFKIAIAHMDSMLLSKG